MDFFASQDLARRNTRKLIFLLVLTVIALTLSVYAVVVISFGLAQPQRVVVAEDTGGDVARWFWSADNALLMLGIASLVICVVSIGSLMKMSELRKGGSSVADLLGGRRLVPGTKDLAERRILNIVEEISLASGVPVPPVYVLDNEPGINAFAAGHTIDDAVIGVNRGTIEKLNRDELQGVIAHEFSHILNGDMRMSVRMIGLLHGIQAIALIGIYLFRTASHMSQRRSGNDKSGNAGLALLALGGGLFLVGSIGLFFARLIKASVSRQREYLADASAVQFTRSPEGISGALKMIGADTYGSEVKAPQAETISHMFFANMQGSLTQNLLATHPPLIPRIQRIEPRFSGQFADYMQTRAKATIIGEREQSKKSTDKAAGFGKRFGMFAKQIDQIGWQMPLDPALMIAAIGSPTDDDMVYSQMLLGHVPDAFLNDCRELFSARCIVFASLLDNRDEVRQRQLKLLLNLEKLPTMEETKQQALHLSNIAARYRLPIFEIIQGTLVGMSAEQFDRFRGTVKELVVADHQISLFEFFLLHHLLIHVARHLGVEQPYQVRFENMNALTAEIELLLSIVAKQGHADATAAEQAFSEGAKSLADIGKGLKFTGGNWDYNLLEQAMRKLVQCAPQVKKGILSAIGLTVIHDGQITIEEAELFRAISESLDCPVPPIIASEPSSAG